MPWEVCRCIGVQLLLLVIINKNPFCICQVKCATSLTLCILWTQKCLKIANLGYAELFNKRNMPYYYEKWHTDLILSFSLCYLPICIFVLFLLSTHLYLCSLSVIYTYISLFSYFIYPSVSLFSLCYLHIYIFILFMLSTHICLCSLYVIYSLYLCFLSFNIFLVYSFIFLLFLNVKKKKNLLFFITLIFHFQIHWFFSPSLSMFYVCSLSESLSFLFRVIVS